MLTALVLWILVAPLVALGFSVLCGRLLVARERSASSRMERGAGSLTATSRP